MSEEQNGKVSNEPSETGVPTPEFSKGSDSPTSTFSPEQIATLSSVLKPVIEEAVERSLQSTKDKRFSKLERGESAIKEALAELRNAGVVIPPEIERDFKTRDYIDERIAAGLNKSAPAPSDNGMSRDVAMQRANSILEKFGIQPNDPELAALWLTKKYVDNPDGYVQMLDDVTNLAAKRVRQPNPQSGQEAALRGGSPAPAGDLKAEYDAKAKSLVGNVDAIAQLRSEYRKKGLKI